MSLLVDIEQLAKQERSSPLTPFFRRQYGGWAWRDMQQREALYSAVIDIYEGRGHTYIDPMPSKTENEARAQPGRVEIPLLMSFVNKWNTLYTKAPTRVFFYDGKRLGAKDRNGAILSEYYARAMSNSVLEQADSLLRLTGNIAIRPFFDAENDSLFLHLYGSHNIRVIPNRKNPMMPQGVALVGRYKKEESDGGSSYVDEAEFFTSDKYGRIDGSKTTVEDLDTIGMPIAFGWERIPTNQSFFVNCPGPGLAAIDRLIANDFTSELGFITIMQGFGIPVTWGLKKGQKFRIGPDRSIDFAGDPERKEDLEFKNPNAPLDDMVGVIKQIIDWIREAYDIPKSMLDATMSPSGVAQVEANAPLGILREKRAELFRPIEQRLVKVIADVLIASGVLPASLDASKFQVAVYYPEPKIVRSTQDQVVKDGFDLTHGLQTPATIYMRDNPDQFDTEQEAAEFLQERTAPIAGGADEEAEGKPGETPDPSVPETTDVQAQALNGAQVSSLLEILTGVSEKTLAPEAAKLAITVSFPLIPKESADAMVNAQAAMKPQPTTPQNSGEPAKGVNSNDGTSKAGDSGADGTKAPGKPNKGV